MRIKVSTLIIVIIGLFFVAWYMTTPPVITAQNNIGNADMYNPMPPMQYIDIEMPIEFSDVLMPIGGGGNVLTENFTIDGSEPIEQWNGGDGGGGDEYMYQPHQRQSSYHASTIDSMAGNIRPDNIKSHYYDD